MTVAEEKNAMKNIDVEDEIWIILFSDILYRFESNTFYRTSK